MRSVLSATYGTSNRTRPAAASLRAHSASAPRCLETNSVAVEVESAARRRLCVFRDGLRERVARLFKRIFACDGLGVPVKELALGVDVQPTVGFRMLVA